MWIILLCLNLHSMILLNRIILNMKGTISMDKENKVLVTVAGRDITEKDIASKYTEATGKKI